MNIDTLRNLFPTGYIGRDERAFVEDTATNSTILATSTDYVTWTLTAAGEAAQLVNEADASAADASGTMAIGLATVPSGTLGITVDGNSQAVVYGTWTIANAAGVTIAGEVRVYDWP